MAVPVYEFVYRRRKVAETLGTVHGPADVAAVLCEYVRPDAGDPAPSAEDIAVTAEMARAGRILDIALLDHVVLGAGGSSASLRALGYLTEAAA